MGYFFLFRFVPRFARVLLRHCTHMYRITDREKRSRDGRRIAWPERRTRGRAAWPHALLPGTPGPLPPAASRSQPPNGLHRLHLGIRKRKQSKDFFLPWNGTKRLFIGYFFCSFVSKENGKTWNSCVQLDVEITTALALIQTLLKFVRVILLTSMRFGSGLARRSNGHFQSFQCLHLIA